MHCSRALGKKEARAMTTLKTKKKLFVGGLSQKTTEGKPLFFFEFGWTTKSKILGKKLPRLGCIFCSAGTQSAKILFCATNHPFLTPDTLLLGPRTIFLWKEHSKVLIYSRNFNLFQNKKIKKSNKKITESKKNWSKEQKFHKKLP